MPPTPAAPAATALTATVRDLADGSIATNIRILFGTADAVTPDVNGVIALPDGATIGSVATTDAPFHVAGWTGGLPGADRSGNGSSPVAEPDAIDGAPTIWVFRDLTLEGNVVVSGHELDMRRVVVSVALAPGGAGHPAGMVQAPWSPAWLRTAGLMPRTERASPATDGEWALTAPRVRGLVLRARGDRKRTRPFARRIETASVIDRQVVAIELGAVRTVSGNVTRPSDVPGDLRVWVELLVEPRSPEFQEFDPGLTHQIGGQGFTATGSDATPDSKATVVLATSATVAADGTFTVPFYDEGNALLIVHAPGCSREEIQLGQLTDTRRDVQVQLRLAGRSTAVRVVRSVRRSVGGRITLVDEGQAVGQTALGPYEIDPATGEFSTDQLQPGRRYFVMFDGTIDGEPTRSDARGWITWSGQTSLDIAKDLRPAR